MITKKRTYVVTLKGKKIKAYTLAEYARKMNIKYQCAYKRMKAGTLNNFVSRDEVVHHYVEV